MYINSSLKNFKIKYRKYKDRYQALKKQLGGECDSPPNPEEEDFALNNLLDLCPDERITIQNKCYKVRSLYTWIITNNQNILPNLYTAITFEEKQRLIQAHHKLHSEILENFSPLDLTVLTREKLIRLIPRLEYETRIELNNKNITSINYDTFHGLPRVSDIRLMDNQISEIHPDTFKNIPILRDIWLNNNQISVLPPFEKIRKLSLNNNQISVLPLNIFEPLIVSLNYLDLSHNQISVLPHGVFNQLYKLEKLYLNNNQIQELQPGIFNKQPDIFGPLYLELLDLSNNQISVIQPNTFKPSVNLDKLYLSNNPIVDTLQPRKIYGLSRQVLIYL
jgi:hypothetical protein